MQPYFAGKPWKDANGNASYKVWKQTYAQYKMAKKAQKAAFFGNPYGVYGAPVVQAQQEEPAAGEQASL